MASVRGKTGRRLQPVANARVARAGKEAQELPGEERGWRGSGPSEAWHSGHAHPLESDTRAHSATGLGEMAGRGAAAGSGRRAHGKSGSRSRRGQGSGSRTPRRNESGGSTGGRGESLCLCWRAGRSAPERWGPEGAVRAEPVLAASGERHSLLLLRNGSVLSCGHNSRGQLGRLGTSGSEQPGE